MQFGVPVAWTFILIAWVYLVKFAYPSGFKNLPGGKEVIANEKSSLGKACFEEMAVLIVFVLAALSWILRSFVLLKINPNIDDTLIVFIVSSVLFFISSNNKYVDCF